MREDLWPRHTDDDLAEGTNGGINRRDTLGLYEGLAITRFGWN